MAQRFKVPGAVGFPALMTHVKTIKRTADAAATSAQQLSDALNMSVAEIEAALNDFPVAVSVSIPTSGWGSLAGSSYYGLYHDIDEESIDEFDLPVVIVHPESMEIAADAQVCGACESMNGKIRVYAHSNPVDTIELSYWIMKGNAPAGSDSGSDSGSGSGSE